MSKRLRFDTLKGRDHSKDLGIDARIILKCILRKKDWTVCIGFMWFIIAKSGMFL
jgi:hypothetical protein